MCYLYKILVDLHPKNSADNKDDIVGKIVYRKW